MSECTHPRASFFVEQLDDEAAFNVRHCPDCNTELARWVDATDPRIERENKSQPQTELL